MRRANSTVRSAGVELDQHALVHLDGNILPIRHPRAPAAQTVVGALEMIRHPQRRAAGRASATGG
jgi:hypothetical protein